MFAKANNRQKFLFIGGIATKYYFWSLLVHFWSLLFKTPFAHCFPRPVPPAFHLRTAWRSDTFLHRFL